MKKLPLLLLLVASSAIATYKQIANLTSTSTSQSTTVKAGSWVGLQCKGGTARFAFGASSATAVGTTGVRVFADQPPLDVKMLPAEDTVAMISEDGSTSVTCSVLNAAH